MRSQDLPVYFCTITKLTSLASRLQLLLFTVLHYFKLLVPWLCGYDAEGRGFESQLESIIDW